MANNIDIVLIPQDKISAVYPMIIRDMQKILAKAKNGYNEKHMMQELLSGDYQLWLIWQKEKREHYGFVVTEIVTRPLSKFCSVIIMTGKERQLWQYKVMKTLERYAIQNGCDKGYSLARKGWTKIYKSHGYKETHVLLEKELKRGEK